MSAVDGTPNCSSEDTPTFEFEIKGALEDAHDGALVSAQKCTKRFNKRLT